MPAFTTRIRPGVEREPARCRAAGFALRAARTQSWIAPLLWPAIALVRYVRQFG